LRFVIIEESLALVQRHQRKKFNTAYVRQSRASVIGCLRSVRICWRLAISGTSKQDAQHIPACPSIRNSFRLDSYAECHIHITELILIFITEFRTDLKTFFFNQNVRAIFLVCISKIYFCAQDIGDLIIKLYHRYVSFI